MRKYLFSTLLLLGSIGLKAQQPSLYSLWEWNRYGINQAYAGLDESLSFTAVYRKQWTNFPGSPSTFAFNGHLPLYIANGGVGAWAENDQIGNFQRISAGLSYNYLFDFSGNAKLSLSAGIGIVQQQLDGASFRAPNGTYTGGTVNHLDALLPNGNASGLSPDFSAGVYFKTRKGLELGLATTHLSAPSLSIQATDAVNIKYSRHFVFTALYDLKLGERTILRPTALIRSDAVKLQPEISLLLQLDNKYTGGISLRGYNPNTLDAVLVKASWKFNPNFSLGYAYDYALSGLQGYQGGSHEVALNYNLNREIGRGRLPKVIYNPRLL